MCSISGIVSTKLNLNKISEMVKCQRHRAPDSEGVFMDNLVSIGMGRLMIIDLITKNLSPIETTRYVLAYNGEIYNYKELKSELISLGYKFFSTSDTEVLIKSWEQWGLKIFNKLNGMYAFSIYDKLQKKIYLARDIAGEKPLYYFYNGKDFIFSSEAKAIAKVVNLQLNLNNEFYDSFQYCFDKTLWKNVNQLKPAHYLVYDIKKNSINTIEYWKFNKRKIYKKEISEELDFLIRDSIKLRLRSDVKIGLYYSGGIDSSLLSAYHKFNYKFHFDDQLNYRNQFYSKLKKIVYHLDFPVGSLSSYPLYCLASKACKKVKVVISGEGADEIFGGYIRYLPIANNYYQFLKYPSYKLMFQKVYGDYKKDYLKIVLKNNNYKLGLKYLDSIFEMFDDPINAIGFFDFKYVMPSLLQMGDRMSSAFGIENRCPYLDKRIIEFGFSLPPEYKINNLLLKIPLRDLLYKKGITKPLNMEKKGLIFNFKSWYNKKDLFRERYFKIIYNTWKNEYSNFNL
jgi:asparagine synthase (glutamine-hydrolysing)